MESFPLPHWWSSGALRHYFSTRAELLAFACEQVIDQVTERIQGLRHTGDPAQAVRAILLETMPVDETRRSRSSMRTSPTSRASNSPSSPAS
ncbi:hypothetical protein [Micromonospora sp. NPDC006431]|uniref:hypothetical protein n=1 Tax=Micromonospora sp. NPDC006431 TaxID=3364235 RepID=UPI0036AB9BD5